MAHEGNDPGPAIIFVAAGFLLVARGVQKLLLRRRLQDTPRSRIASAPQGLTEIQGYAWPVERVSITLGGRRAVYHEIQLEEWDKDLGESGGWATRWKHSRTDPFYTIDASGAVRVSPDVAELEVAWKEYPWESLSSQSKAQALRLGVAAPRFPAQGRFRFRERAILLGCPIYANGVLQANRSEIWIPGHRPLVRFREFLERMGHKGASRNFGFDRNRDGEVCQAEAERGMHEVAEGAANAAKHDNDTPIGDPMKVCGLLTSVGERKLVLAECHKEHFLARIGSNHWLMVAGGAALVGFGVLMAYYYEGGS